MSTADDQRATDFAADLRHLATMVEDTPDLVDLLWTMRSPNVPVSVEDDATEALARAVRLGLAADCKIDKSYDDWANVDLTLPAGAIRLHFYADREQVCTRRVVGTREVTVEVPDPDAPKVTVTEVVEDVEWDCHPLLAATDTTATEAVAS